jgi:signal transduction histidine kinase
VSPEGYTLVGFSALIAVLIALLTYALLRFVSAARETRQRMREGGGESPLMAMALQDAIQKLRAQERAMTERAEASERLSTQIVNSLTAGLLVTDPEGVIQIMNPAGRKMLGITGTVEGKRIGALPPPAAPLAAVVDECLKNGQPIFRRALEVPHADEVTHVGVTVSGLGQGAPHLGGVICLFSDLTAVIALEEQLRLKETLARLGELTAGIAHEFRNGLATIHGYGKLLDPAALPPQFRPYVEGIRQETHALGEVVTNFLNFARPTQLSLATHDLNAVVERAADDLRNDVQQLGGEILITGQFGRVDGDDVLLRQAFSNLFRNAVEACQSTGAAPRVHIEGTLDHAQGVSRISVHDNGPGIDRDVRDRIFRPFFTTKKTGTGLGLALVQKIIVTHNGRVSAGSSPAGGACFQVTLPLA